jgi:hypothetical protein
LSTHVTFSRRREEARQQCRVMCRIDVEARPALGDPLAGAGHELAARDLTAIENARDGGVVVGEHVVQQQRGALGRRQ